MYSLSEYFRSELNSEPLRWNIRRIFLQTLFRSATHCYFCKKVHLRYSTEFEYHSAESHLVTATPRQIVVESTCILHWYVRHQISTNFHVINLVIISCSTCCLDEFPRHFRVLFWYNFDGRKIHVVSTYSFRRNFDVRKIHVVSTYFYWCNFAGPKIHVVSTYFFWCNFSGGNMHVFFTYFSRRNFDGQKFDIVFGKL